VISKRMHGQRSESAEPASSLGKPEVFAHPSERIAAQILDYYEIRWEYEPTTFALEWDSRGNPVSSFTPDFYLPDLELYIELTTMNQKLVTRKNRKVRKLRELYPHVNVIIFYQRDFRNLLLKYGLHAPSEKPLEPTESDVCDGES